MCVHAKDLGNELAQSSACHKAMPQGSNIGQQTADSGQRIIIRAQLYISMLEFFMASAHAITVQ